MQLGVELDEGVHGYGYGGGLDCYYLLKGDGVVSRTQNGRGGGGGEERHTQICPNMGELLLSQYRPWYWLNTAATVMATRTKQ